jgi:hypothetical protein
MHRTLRGADCGVPRTLGTANSRPAPHTSCPRWRARPMPRRPDCTATPHARRLEWLTRSARATPEMRKTQRQCGPDCRAAAQTQRLCVCEPYCRVFFRRTRQLERLTHTGCVTPETKNAQCCIVQTLGHTAHARRLERLSTLDNAGAARPRL